MMVTWEGNYIGIHDGRRTTRGSAASPERFLTRPNPPKVQSPGHTSM